MEPICWRDALTSQANGATKRTAPGTRMKYASTCQLRRRLRPVLDGPPVVAFSTGLDAVSAVIVRTGRVVVEGA